MVYHDAPDRGSGRRAALATRAVKEADQIQPSQRSLLPPRSGTRIPYQDSLSIRGSSGGASRTVLEAGQLGMADVDGQQMDDVPREVRGGVARTRGATLVRSVLAGE